MSTFTGYRSLLVYFVAATIPLAPLFNAIGRFAAWAELPYGIGGLYFAGHPLKMFNILLLFGIGLLAIRRLKINTKVP